MEHPWLFYFLFFIFGYSTCHTFYFLNSIRKSLQLLRLTQVVALFIIARSLEDFAFAKNYAVLYMKENKKSEQDINEFEMRHKDDVELFKTKTIQSIIDAHGSYFSEVVDFEDWKGAMVFLNKNKRTAFEFLTKKGVRND